MIKMRSKPTWADRVDQQQSLAADQQQSWATGWEEMKLDYRGV